ncbi:MAG TPA: DUF4340 domain-containing protein [Gammaproteobacteria bacterium]|nr:DUF4340 domain-containing protein [Gammaproteobacteria bacterium]
MNSRGWINLLLVLLLLGLLAIAIYEPGKPNKAEVPRITGLMPQNVHKLRIEDTGRTPVLLRKDNGRWMMTSPLRVPADEGRIESLLRVLQAKSIAQYPMSQVDANQLQLDSPVLVLRVDDMTLRFGTTDALGGSRYVQVGNTVHLITDRYSHLVRGPATNLISPLLLPMQEAAAIVALELPGLHLQQEEGRWTADGKMVPGDARQTLLDEWRHARALRVTIAATSPGASQATQHVRIWLKHKDTLQSVDFSLLAGDSEVILRRDDLDIQYHLPTDAARRLLALPAAHPGRQTAK